MKWVEIPAIRVLEVDVWTLVKEFNLFTEDGTNLLELLDASVDASEKGYSATQFLSKYGYRAHIIVRNDGKVFRWQPYWVMDPHSQTFYLQEV